MNKALLATIGFCVLFGLQIVLQQKFLISDIKPLHLSFLTNFGCFLILSVFMLFTKQLSKPVKPGKRTVLFFFISTFFWISADLASMFGLKLSSSVNFSLISRMQVFITYLLAAVFFNEVFKKNKTLSIILSFVGGIFVVYNFNSSLKFNVGDLLFLWFTIAISLSGLLRQSITKNVSPLKMTHFMYLVSSVVLGLLVLLFDPLKKIDIPFFILINSVLAFTGFYFVNLAISIGGATFFSVVSSLLPLFTAVFAFFILQTVPALNQIIGGAVIIFSIFLFRKK